MKSFHFKEVLLWYENSLEKHPCHWKTHKFWLCGFPLERPWHSIYSKQLHQVLARCIYFICYWTTMSLGEPQFLYASVPLSVKTDDRDFIRSPWKPWEWCPLAATSCRCSLHKRPLPSMVRMGQGSSCWGGGEATGNEGPVKQAWAELLPGFAMTEEVTAAFILPSLPFCQAAECLPVPKSQNGSC